MLASVLVQKELAAEWHVARRQGAARLIFVAGRRRTVNRMRLRLEFA
jgi:hypothetical protein